MKNRFIVVVTVMIITTTMLVHLCQILSVLCCLQCRAEPAGFACDDPEHECLNHRPEDFPKDCKPQKRDPCRGRQSQLFTAEAQQRRMDDMDFQTSPINPKPY